MSDPVNVNEIYRMHLKRRSVATRYAISDNPLKKLYGKLMHLEIDLQQQADNLPESSAAPVAEAARILRTAIMNPLWGQIAEKDKEDEKGEKQNGE